MADLLGGLSAEVLNGIGVVTLAVLFVVALARGWLVTGTSHAETITAHGEAIAAKDREFDRMVTLKDGTIERLKGEKDDWRDAYRAADSRGDVLAEQVKELVVEHRTFNHFMESMREVVNRGGDT